MNPDIALSPDAIDVQSGQPETPVSLSRVGVTGVEKVLSIGGGHYHTRMECFVDLAPDQAGVHMSRFEENVSEAIEGVVASSAMHTEVLAARVAELVREKQHGVRAEVSITASFAENRPAPASGIENQEIYTLLGTAVAANGRETRMVTGVQAQGMTACPCAQEMVTDVARTRLTDQGFSPEQIDTIIDVVPIATHNQRGIGTLWIGRAHDSDPEIDARDLLRLVESSMSSEIYELMKRPDELAVVVAAHENPRFVEDCVREMMRQVVTRYDALSDESFVMARQENLETIHRHNVVAERYGPVGNLRREMEGDHTAANHMTMREWLDRPVA